MDIFIQGYTFSVDYDIIKGDDPIYEGSNGGYPGYPDEVEIKEIYYKEKNITDLINDFFKNPEDFYHQIIEQIEDAL